METSMTVYGRRVLFALALGMTSSVLAQAPDIKAGLWEMQMQGGKGPNMPDMAKMQQAMQQMKAQLAQMPPEQRKMVEAQMSNMGVSVTDSGGIRICMTEDDIRRQDIPINEGNCKTTIKERTAKRWSASMVCTDPAMKGEATAVFESPQAYTVAVKGEVTEGGKKQPYDMTMKWKYVSSNCGAIKPRPATKP